MAKTPDCQDYYDSFDYLLKVDSLDYDQSVNPWLTKTATELVIETSLFDDVGNYNLELNVEIQGGFSYDGDDQIITSAISTTVPYSFIISIINPCIDISSNGEIQGTFLYSPD